MVILSVVIRLNAAPTSDELVLLHNVTTTEMNAIASPSAGSLVYNTTENATFFYTGTVWKKMRSSGDETIVTAGSGITVSGNGTPSSPYVIGQQ